MAESLRRRVGARILIQSLVLTLIFSAGAAAGIYLDSHSSLEHDDHDHEDESHLVDDPHEEDEAHEDEEDHVALSEQAVGNLGLKLGEVSSSDYQKTLLVPGRVVEIPGRSDMSISAPVTGVIEDVSILPGQSIAPTTQLLTMKLTDEPLIDAQSKLLETLTRNEVIQKELERLAPLIKSGVTSGSKRRELEYEAKQLKALEATLLQELRGRGLPQDMIDGMYEDRKLVSKLKIFPPTFVDQESRRYADSQSGYSVEDLLVHPGKSVGRGESLCTVAYHSSLYVEGIAFEADLATLFRIAERGWKVTVESHGDHGHSHDAPCVELLRVDNHVDEETQTVKFFIELPNQITGIREADNRLFEQWRFRPGQRLHLRLPVEEWQDQLVLAKDAVVVDGPNAFVFAEHHHEEEEEELDAGGGQSDESDDHAEEHEELIEFEPVPVRVLHRDDKHVVIANDGQILAGTPIVLNHAYKLYLAMKMQAGGGGHHHHHDH